MSFMDADGSGSCEPQVVSEPARLHLVLEIEQGRDPVRGWLQNPDGARERFEGLLELLAVLDAARGVDRARDRQPDNPSR
jgi:hypothetical protein